MRHTIPAMPSMRAIRLLLLLTAPLVFSACSLTETEPDDVRRAFITRVNVEATPLTQPNGDGWDGSLGGGPDVYFLLYGSGGVQLLNGESDSRVSIPGGGSNYGDVTINDFPLIYTVDNAEFNDLDRQLYVEVKDDDPTTTDDTIETTRTFTLREFLPSTLPSDGTHSFAVASASGNTSVRITVRYAR